jgi:2-polyprenyl-6-methoxyphenol hydroxylase-like FAD-dependent oxidoreductase
LERNGVRIDRPWTISGFKNDGESPEYPVQVNLTHVDGESQCTVRTKYLFGADGARSFVREQLGIRMIHKDPTVYIWSVIDGVVRTDFPDIQVRKKQLCSSWQSSANRYCADEMYSSFR